MNKNNYAAIMAGGIGSRFWPMSRTNYPKQFLDILNTGKTLLQATYERYLSFVPNKNIYIITAEEYVDIVRKQLPELPPHNVIGEPERKNTAPCILYMSLKLQKMNPDANLIIAPSDHLIDNKYKFEANCKKALNFTAKNNAFVTLGIKPTHANTGYGYIQFEENSPLDGIKNVLRFTEKPDKNTAIKFINEETYLWNSGIFFWKASDIINAFKNFKHEMYDLFMGASLNFNTPLEEESIKYIFKSCESISIDYAILEKAKNVYVIPADFSWSDLGTWNSAWENSNKDFENNALAGENIMLFDTKGSIVHSTDKKLILLGGVEDLIVVNTTDSVLI